MINMEPRVDRISGESCFTLAVHNILNYKKYKNFLRVWKQCGLTLRTDNNEFGILDPKLTSSKAELKLLTNIDLYYYVENNANKMLEAILSLVNKGEPVIVFVDAYQLEYNSAYKNRHARHCITLIGQSGENCVFIDDYYQRKDVLSIEKLLKNMDISRTPFKYDSYRFRYAWIDCENAFSDIDKHSFLNVLTTNVDHLKDGISIGCTKSMATIYGLPSLDVFVNNIESRINEDILSEETLDDLYSSLTSVSNSRYLYSEFLKNGERYSSEFSSLVLKYIECAQSWKVAANMALKSRYSVKKSGREAMILRMIQRLKDIKKIEKNALEMVESIVRSLKQ